MNGDQQRMLPSVPSRKSSVYLDELTAVSPVTTAAIGPVLPDLFDRALPPLAVFETDGRPVYANQPFRHVLGIGDELLETSSACAQFGAVVLRLVEEQTTYPQRFQDDYGPEAVAGAPRDNGRSIAFGGRVFHIEHTMLEVGDAGSQLIATVLKEVTEQAKLLEQASQAQKRLSDFVDCASDWLWECDERGRITYLSRRLTQIAGVPAQLLQNRRFGDFCEFVEPVAADLSETESFRSRQPFRDMVVEIKDRNEERHQQWLSGVPVFDPANSRFMGYRGTGADMTQRIAIETALRDSQRRLTSTLADLRQKNSELATTIEAAQAGGRAKREFLAHMSHELRTPLNAIIGFSEMLHLEVFGNVGNDQYRAYSKDIHHSANHLLALITDILELSTIESGDRTLCFEPIDVGDVARDRCAAFAEDVARKRLTMGLRPAEAAVPLTADRRAVQQILDHLINNAVKYTPDGGQINVEIAPTSRDVHIAVRDTGIGIAAEDLNRVTEPFERGGGGYGQAHDGIGLGLTLAKALTELHGGRLELASRIGDGTTVKVILPLRAVQREPA